MTLEEIEVWWNNKPEVDKLLKRPIFGHWMDVTDWLIRRVKELEPDALYLRKWREIKGSNPFLPCACQIDDDGKLVSQCEAHREIIDGLEAREKELEELATKQDEMLEVAATRINKTEAIAKEAKMTREEALKWRFKMPGLLARSLEILKDIYDEGECQYDHHGSCQTHGWINMGNCPCPHMRARALFEEIEAG